MSVPVAEAQLESFFRKRIRMVGGYTLKLAPTELGVPDRLVILGGQLYLVELKAEGGALSDVQKAYHRKLAGFGVRVAVLTGKAEVLAWIRSRFRTEEED